MEFFLEILSGVLIGSMSIGLGLSGAVWILLDLPDVRKLLKLEAKEAARPKTGTGTLSVRDNENADWKPAGEVVHVEWNFTPSKPEPAMKDHVEQLREEMLKRFAEHYERVNRRFEVQFPPKPSRRKEPRKAVKPSSPKRA